MTTNYQPVTDQSGVPPGFVAVRSYPLDGCKDCIFNEPGQACKRPFCFPYCGPERRPDEESVIFLAIPSIKTPTPTPTIPTPISTMTTSTIEYLVISDTTSKIIKSSSNYNEIVKLANDITKCGGQVTIFRSLSGRKSKTNQKTKQQNQGQEIG